MQVFCGFDWPGQDAERLRRRDLALLEHEPRDLRVEVRARSPRPRASARPGTLAASSTATRARLAAFRLVAPCRTLSVLDLNGHCLPLHVIFAQQPFGNCCVICRFTSRTLDPLMSQVGKMPEVRFGKLASPPAQSSSSAVARNVLRAWPDRGVQRRCSRTGAERRRVAVGGGRCPRRCSLRRCRVVRQHPPHPDGHGRVPVVAVSGLR